MARLLEFPICLLLGGEGRRGEGRGVRVLHGGHVDVGGGRTDKPASSEQGLYLHGDSIVNVRREVG